jgi:AcrR family transcriptional regulator
MSTIQNKEQTTQRIISSALHSFTQQGLPNVSLEYISQSLGLKQEEILSHFESKEALIESILETHLASMKVCTNLKNRRKTLYQLLSFLDEKSILNEEESNFLPIFSQAFLPYVNSKKLKHNYKMFYDELYDFYLEEIEKRIEHGELNEELNTDTLSNMLVSMLDAAVVHKGVFKEYSEETFVKEQLALLYYELLRWQLRLRNNRIKRYASKLNQQRENFMNFVYQKFVHKEQRVKPLL